MDATPSPSREEDHQKLLGVQAFSGNCNFLTTSRFAATQRTEGSTAFQVIGVDFAEPIKYRRSGRVGGKAYLVLFSCSLSRALHLEILPTLETATFLGTLKRLIARRGRPSRIYSDNGRTFIEAAKWLKQIRKDGRVQSYLADEEIHWRFNLSRAPWWGGQFERQIGLFKQAFFKPIGGGMLSWTELCEVVLDVETQLNRRPLSHVDNDIQFPLLTPASFLFQRSNRLYRKLGESRPGTFVNEQSIGGPVKMLFGNAGPESTWRLLENGITATEKTRTSR